ncbi:MAG: GNAT family N-acetyltransferase [Limnochordia bacterium]
MEATSIRIRGYQGGDEKSLIACWNASLPYDTINEQVFVRKVLCDSNFDPEGLVVAEGPHTEIVGFVLALVRRTPLFGSDLEPSDGWITAFAVSPAWRRQGIGRALFAAADRFLRARGRKCVSFAPYAPHYFVPGIDAQHYPEGAALLSAMGFGNLYPCVSMDISLPLFVIPTDVQATVWQRQQEGYRFEPLSLPYVLKTIDLAHSHFHADWGRCRARGLGSWCPP